MPQTAVMTRPSPLQGEILLCGSKCRDGSPCTQPAMANGRCRMHSGGAAEGIAHPAFKHGRYSRLAAAMPKYLREKSEEALEDWESLTDLSDKLSAQEAMLVDLYEKLPTGESGETWKALKEHWAAYEEAERNLAVSGTDDKAYRKWDSQRVQAMESVKYLIAEGATEWQTREAIGKELDRYTAISAVETKRREKAATVQSMFLVKSLLSIIQQYTANEHKGTVQRLLSGLFTGRGR